MCVNSPCGELRGSQSQKPWADGIAEEIDKTFLQQLLCFWVNHLSTIIYSPLWSLYHVNAGIILFGLILHFQLT